MPMNRRLHYSTSTSGEIFGSAVVFPDLLALDQDGNLVIINLDWCHPLFVVTSAVMAASSANAARDTAFAEMAEETETIGDPEDPASQASADSLEAAAGMATYVEAQGSLPMPGNPAAVAAGATTQLNALNQSVLNELQNNSGQLTPEIIQALIDYHRSQGTLYEATSRGRSPKWGFAIPIAFPDGTNGYLVVEYISPGIFRGGRYVVAGVAPGSVDPRRAIEAWITEPHQNSQLDNALRAFEFGMAMIPGLSDALDLGESIFGYDWTTGDRLDSAGRMDALRAATLPGSIGRKNVQIGNDLLNGLRKNPEVTPNSGVRNFDIIPYRPTTSPFENHHGILDVWAKNNISNYVSRGRNTPTIALTKAQNDATIEVYRSWLLEKTGK